MTNKNNGFTLLEILIAIFIFAFIAVIATTVLSTVFDTRAETTTRTNELAKLQIATLLMQRDIEQIVNRPIRTANGNLSPALIATPSKLELTRMGHSNPLGLLQRSNLQRVAYVIGNGKLIRVTWPRLDRTPSTKPNERVLLDNIVAGTFSYLDNSNTFYQHWPPGILITTKVGQAVLPKAIAITLTLKKWGKLYLIIPIG